MIQLHNTLTVEDIIELGRFLEDHKGLDISHFYAEVEENDVCVWGYFPGNGLYVGQSAVIHFFEGKKIFLEYIQQRVQDYNTLLNLKPPAEDLSNTQ